MDVTWVPVMFPANGPGRLLAMRSRCADVLFPTLVPSVGPTGEPTQIPTLMPTYSRVDSQHCRPVKFRPLAIGLPIIQVLRRR